MNPYVAHRFTRGFLIRFQNASLNRGQEKRLFCRNQLSRFSESNPKALSKPQQKQQRSIAPKPESPALNSNSNSISPLQRLFDHWNTPSSSGRDDASLARYPNWQTPGGLLRGADYAGTLTFALSGTITAAQSGLDVFGSVVVGIITSVGGGTIRDAIFLNRKPFWTEETEYIWMGMVMGIVTFFVWPQSVLEWQRMKQKEAEKKKERQQQQRPENKIFDRTNTTATANNNASAERYDTVDGVLDTLDAVGLSAFAIIGAQNGIRAKMPLLVSAICGMTTATFGGLIRDVLCGRPVRIVHSNTEVYAPPALAGAIVYLVAKTAGGSSAVRIGAAFATCMGSRLWAVLNDVKLHTWDTNHDNLGVTVRKRTTKTAPNYRNE